MGDSIMVPCLRYGFAGPKIRPWKICLISSRDRTKLESQVSGENSPENHASFFAWTEFFFEILVLRHQIAALERSALLATVD